MGLDSKTREFFIVFCADIYFLLSCKLDFRVIRADFDTFESCKLKHTEFLSSLLFKDPASLSNYDDSFIFLLFNIFIFFDEK